MARRGSRFPDLADVVAWARAHDLERQRPAEEVTALATRLAARFPGPGDDRAAIAAAWLDEREAGDPTIGELHHRATVALQATDVLLGIGGVLLGWGATLAAFYFDGSGRVNAVAVLALLVAVPGLMLVPFFLAALPAGVAQRVPGVGMLAALARALSPGRLAAGLWRVFPQDLRQALALLAGRSEAHRRLYATLQKWALLRWSQWFAVWFQTAALVACLVLVVFTDLAFGWSTTLTSGDAARDARRVHAATTVVSAPWSWAWPSAEPSLALIEESRYFRAAADPVTRAEAARLGGWWKFVVMGIVVYGLLPRLLTLAFAGARLRAATRAAMLGGPAFSTVLRRLHRAQVETRAVEPERVESATALAVESREGESGGEVQAVINWAGVPVTAAALAARFPQAEQCVAGGASTMQDDLAVARRLAAAARSREGDILVLVKAWEPPLMEFLDFLRALRAELGSDRGSLVVYPVGLDSGQGLAAPTAGQLKVWRDQVARLGDPWLRISTDQEVRA